MSTMNTTPRHPPAGLPRLLAGPARHGPLSLAEHHEVHGPAPLARGRRERRAAGALVKEVSRAGLRGRGGAAFPTAVKMRAVLDARGRAILVANGVEGEPASRKDGTLLQTQPHLVIDGALLAAQAVAAERAIVCVAAGREASLDCVERALAERAQHDPPGAPAAVLAAVPDSYVSGHESALVNHLNGGPPLPTFTPPMIFERGVQRRPTLLDNVETLAHVALIARHGADWFRELGSAEEPGSLLVTLSGPVGDPGVYEIEPGTSLSALLRAAGGLTSRVRAALLGGYAGAWIGPQHLRDLTLCDSDLAALGASLGAGVVLLLAEDACGVAETVRVTRWMASQSAGQCGPCVHGLDALAGELERLAGGDRDAPGRRRIADLGLQIRRRGACAHPDGAVRFVVSALEVFGADFAEHAEHGLCAACERAGQLPLDSHFTLTGA
jgi:NADH:ubiquinone oxidoreductase subunit F (NADH-binding)